MTVVPIFAQKPHPSEEIQPSEEPQKSRSSGTLELATQDVRIVIAEQKQQTHLLTTKLNILFVVNGALLTTLMISRLVTQASAFSFAEILGFFVNFTLLINAFLPRQVAVSPNLGDTKFLEKYLALGTEEYQLQMLVNQVATYNTNKQRLDDVSQSLTYSAYVTWTIAVTILLHMVSSYFFNELGI
ncbi:MAG: hypothetical protein MUD14_27145 [Hydrococcus sp. Prado102]|jgi:hypothetical protein|nr:hypothetical protein [Hydrococcus sp. Prado102]